MKVWALADRVGLVTVGIIASPPTSVFVTWTLSLAATSGTVVPCVNLGRDPSSSQMWWVIRGSNPGPAD